MKTTFDLILPELFGDEGGFANRSAKADPGGPTMLGITQDTLEEWRERPVSAAEVKRLTREEAAQIYKAQYWDTVSGDQMPRGLDYALFDYAVNSGPATAIKTLQTILGVAIDGVVGIKTMRAIRQHSVDDLITRLCDARLAFMKRLRNWGYNKNGWTRRVRRVKAKSISLASYKFVPKPAAKPVVQDTINEEGGAKARPEKTSALSAWLTPEGLTQAGIAASGFSGILAGSGPLQWGFAAALVLAVGVGGYLMICKARTA